MRSKVLEACVYSMGLTTSRSNSFACAVWSVHARIHKLSGSFRKFEFERRPLAPLDRQRRLGLTAHTTPSVHDTNVQGTLPDARRRRMCGRAHCGHRARSRVRPWQPSV